MAKAMLTSKVSNYPPCDVCKIEFPGSKPNEARFDGPCGGPWAFMCTAHVRKVPGMTRRLVLVDVDERG